MMAVTVTMTMAVSPTRPLPGSPVTTDTIGNAGAGQSHENRMPFQVLNYRFALERIYPSTS